MDNIFLLFGEICPTTAEALISFLLENSDKDVNILINSEGGDVDSCIAIIEAIEFHKKHNIVSTIAIGSAYSSGAMILASGTVGYRFITELTTVFFHQIQVDLPEDSFKKHENYLKFQGKHSGILNKRIAKYCGKTIKNYEKLLDDSWLTAQEALKMKIVDKIIHDYEFVGSDN